VEMRILRNQDLMLDNDMIMMRERVRVDMVGDDVVVMVNMAIDQTRSIKRGFTGQVPESVGVFSVTRELKRGYT
jgi:hypothetical protein